jgi:hypothetical protein
MSGVIVIGDNSEQVMGWNGSSMSPGISILVIDAFSII